jgi:hypothetical protein
VGPWADSALGDYSLPAVNCEFVWQLNATSQSDTR